MNMLSSALKYPFVNVLHLVNTSYFNLLVNPGTRPLLGAPHLLVVGLQEKDGGGNEEQQQEQQPLPGCTTQRQHGHAAVPGGRQAGQSYPEEKKKNITNNCINKCDWTERL